MKDRFNLTYIKDGIIYPVALSKEQDRIFQNIVPSLLSDNGKISVVQDRPLGEAIMAKSTAVVHATVKTKSSLYPPE